jgi:hypothetical protein
MSLGGKVSAPRTIGLRGAAARKEKPCKPDVKYAGFWAWFIAFVIGPAMIDRHDEAKLTETGVKTAPCSATCSSSCAFDERRAGILAVPLRLPPFYRARCGERLLVVDGGVRAVKFL